MPRVYDILVFYARVTVTMSWHRTYQITCILALLTLITPLVIAPQSMVFPFVTPKVFLLRLLVEAALASMLILFYQQPLFRGVSGGWVSKAWIAYSIALILSAIFGVAPYHSWWSGHERMLGVFSVLHYALLFGLLIRLFRGYDGEVLEGKQLYGYGTVLKVLWGVMVILAGIGIAQRFAHTSLLYAEPGGRVYATLGNFIYLGNVMAGGIFLALILWYKEKIVRWMYLLSVIPMSMALMFAESRGATIGLLSGILVSALTYCLLAQQKSRRIALTIIASACVMISLVFVPAVQTILKQTPLARVTSLNLKDVTPRFIAWNVAVESWKQKPLFGWGFENFLYAFDTNFNPQSTEFSFYETWFDDAHNIILNTLATTGIIGLCAYLGLYGAMIYCSVSRFRSGSWTALECALLIGLLTADLMGKVFVFDHPTSYLVLACIAGYVCIPEVRSSKQKKVHLVLVGSGVLLLVWMIVSTVILPARANMAIVHLYRETAMGGSVDTLIQGALHIESPYHADIASDIAHHTRGSLFQGGNSDRKMTVLSQVIARMETERVQSPYDLQLVIAEADLFTLLPQTEEHYQTLMQLYDAMISLSPKRQQLFYMRARVQTAYKKYDEAIETLNSAEALDLNVNYTFIQRGSVYHEQGNNEKAWADIRHATLEHNAVPQNYPEYQTSWAIYQSAGFANVWYPLAMRALAQSYGTDLDQASLQGLATEFVTIGAYSAAEDVNFTLHKVYNTPPVAIPVVKNDIQKSIDHYTTSGLLVPPQLLTAQAILAGTDACSKAYSSEYLKFFYCLR